MGGAESIVESARAWLVGFEWLVLGYFVILNTVYLVLTALAAVELTRYFRRAAFAGFEDVFANPMTPGVSIIVPAFNEEVGIVDNVRAMLSLRFPSFEVVVVDDGSTDATFERLRDEFRLVEVPRHALDVIPTIGRILSMHVATEGEPLVVVRKENAGSGADATNAGINVSRMPLLCRVDADSLLDPEALLRVVKPFVDDPDRVIATGGVIRPANGCVVERGAITRVGMPRQWLPRIQVVEYLRSFLMGRTGWSALRSLVIISGAFAMFRRDLVLEVGGLDAHSMGEDAELVVAMHRHLREQGRRDYRIVFVSEPVCWTEVPSSLSVLRRQRRRWARGLAEVIWKHKKMLFNPRYGRIGLVVLPYFLFFELLGPIVELLGLVTFVSVIALAAAGAVFDFHTDLLDLPYAALFAIVALGYGFLLSAAAITIEEFSYRRMSSARDLSVSLAASVVESLGYRQLHSWWRLEGLWWWLRRGESTWGHMPRSGYTLADTPKTQWAHRQGDDAFIPVSSGDSVGPPTDD